MALDFHIAKNENDAPLKKPSASFELQAHDLIFYRFGLAKDITDDLSNDKFPLFNRLKNYYKDTHYHLDELPLLLSEVKALSLLFLNNDQLVEQLKCIESACVEALAKDMQLWVYCD